LDSSVKSKIELINQWLRNYKKEKINLHFPLIQSRRKKILEMAYLNLDNEINNYYYIKKNLENGLKNLKEKLYLKKSPYVIECFDISNIQGKDAVAAMSVAVGGKLEKKRYRKFKIKTKDTPDDFAMMKEVLRRRYSKLYKEELPDLILLDGGKGQLSIGEAVLGELDKTDKIELISIAKREEEVFKSGEREPYILSKTSEELKILQRLRDEAHRFGVKYHRTLRKKRIINSELDEIKGVGEIRKEKLLRRFKSVKRIFEASLEELEEVVPREIALKLKERGKKN
jgi:excinuclease ABC subunit C